MDVARRFKHKREMIMRRGSHTPIHKEATIKNISIPRDLGRLGLALRHEETNAEHSLIYDGMIEGISGACRNRGLTARNDN